MIFSTLVYTRWHRNIETRLHTKYTLSVLDTIYQNGSMDFSLNATIQSDTIQCKIESITFPFFLLITFESGMKDDIQILIFTIVFSPPL